ncbi:MAG: hypothetical protein QXG36_08025 [Nitrososphaeria archaeon]
MVNPIFNFYSIIEKVKRRIVYIPSNRRFIEILPKIYAFPVLLPEIGVLTSLDVTSEQLAKKIYESVSKDFESLISSDKIFISNIYNFDPKKNRIVSWGTMKTFNVDFNIYQLYLRNLFTDLLLTPSIITKEKIFSPNRWFYATSESYSKFQANINYNICVLYLEKDKLQIKKKKKIWLNYPLELYEIKAGVVIFQPDGYLRYYEPVFIYLTSEPSEIINIASDKGDYFLTSLISLNDYATTYINSDIKQGCLNIVDTLSEIVLSPWEIFPLLFPFLANKQKLSSLIFEFEVKENTFSTLKKRLMKFGAEQNPEIIRAYEELIKKENRAMEIIKTENIYVVKIVNPTLIPYLIKKVYDPNIEEINKIYPKELLNASDFLRKIKIIEEQNKGITRTSSNRSTFYKMEYFLKNRERLMDHFLTIYQKTTCINKVKNKGLIL